MVKTLDTLNAAVASKSLRKHVRVCYLAFLQTLPVWVVVVVWRCMWMKPLAPNVTDVIHSLSDHVIFLQNMVAKKATATFPFLCHLFL